MGPGRWNSADHRAVGRSVLDAVSDADNEWIFPELLAEGLGRHKVRWVAISSPQPNPSSRLSVRTSIEKAVASLAEHARVPAGAQSRAGGDAGAAAGGDGDGRRGRGV